MQRLEIGRPEEGVIVGAEAHAAALEVPGNDVVSVEVVGGLERQEGSDAHHEGPEHLIPDLEVVVRVAGALPGHDPVGGVVRRVLRDVDAKLRPLFLEAGLRSKLSKAVAFDVLDREIPEHPARLR